MIRIAPPPLHRCNEVIAIRSDYCAIDFGTSSSAIALPPASGESDRPRTVAIERDHTTMPTAMFYDVEDLEPGEDVRVHFGRAAIATYLEGVDGRLMRSMKSILGTSLADRSTEIGVGRSLRYRDAIARYLRELRLRAEQAAGTSLSRVILGRPVHFIDDDPVRDQAAQDALELAARDAGFSEIFFQFEPSAAALDYETGVDDERIVLVADIGGGTSDFSVVRVGPHRRHQLDRRDDILANHGVHVAGTDFDRRIDLAAILPVCGFRGPGRDGRTVPGAVYFDLATWHLINTVYSPARVQAIRSMRPEFGEPGQHDRLMRVVTARLAHALLGHAEAAKIAVAEGRPATIDLAALEAELQVALTPATAAEAIEADLGRIAGAADETLRLAGIDRGQVQAVYFTGGSTGLPALTERIAGHFPAAQAVHGDRFGSVAQGLGVHARTVFGPAAAHARC